MWVKAALPSLSAHEVDDGHDVSHADLFVSARSDLPLGRIANPTERSYLSIAVSVDHHLAAIAHIDALLSGLAAEAAPVECVPAFLE